MQFKTVYKQPTSDGTKGDLRKAKTSEGQTVYEAGEIDGLRIPLRMQHGTLLENGVNGLMLEQLLFVVKDRLEDFQAGDFACEENEIALIATKNALDMLEARARARIAQGVEGKHERHDSQGIK